MSNFNEKGNLELTSVASDVQTDNEIIRNITSDGDILIYVNDGGTDTVALTIDASVPSIIANVGVELDMTATNALDASGATITNIFKFADGQGAVVGSMTAKSPETDAEAGYLKIDVGGTSYEIPFYAIA